MRKLLIAIGAAAVLLVASLSAGCSGPSKNGPLSEQYEFEDDGQIRSIVGLDGGTTSYSHDRNGNLTAITFQAGSVRYAYDASNRIIREDDGPGVTEYFYNAGGEVAHVLLRRARAWLLTYRYDLFGNLAAIRADDLARAQADSGLAPLVGPLLAKSAPGDAQRVSRERAVAEFADRVEATGVAATYRVRYRYDATSRLIESQDESGITHYSYPAAFSIERRLPNGITTRVQADTAGRPLHIAHLDPGGSTLAGFDYAYDAVGRLASVHERDARAELQLGLVRNASGRVARVTSAGETTEIALDGAGRFKSLPGGRTPLAYDAFGRVIQVGDLYLDRDVAGRIERMRRGRSEVQVRYDGRGVPYQLTADRIKFDLVHDGAGRLTSVKAGGERLDFLHDPLNGDDTPLLSWNSGAPTMDRRYYALDPYAVSAEGGLRFTLRDGLGTPRLTIDPSGTVVDTQGGSRSFDDMLDSVTRLQHVFDRVSGSAPQPDARKLSWRAPIDRAGLPLVLALATPLGGAGQAPKDDRSRTIGVPRKPLATDAAELARVLAEVQYLDAAGFYSATAPAGVYAQQMERRLTTFVQHSRASSIDIYVMGVGTGWAEANRDTRDRCGDGSCIFMPSFASSPTLAHAAFDKVMGTLPGDPMPRKMDYPRLLEIAAAGGKRVNSIVCESGCGVELQRDRVIGDLVRYAGTTSNKAALPLIVVQSTDIGGQASRLRSAGYQVKNIGERAAFDSPARADGGSLLAGDPDGIVPYLVRPSEEALGLVGRVPVIGRLVRPAGLSVQLPRAAGFAVFKMILGQNPVGPHGVSRWWDSIQHALTEHRDQRVAVSGNAVAATAISDTFDDTERALGGIELLARTDAFSELGHIRGIHIDEQGRLVAVGDGQVTAEGIQAADIALALALASEPGGAAPQFSLDPADRKHPDGEWLRTVYYPESMKGTAFGQTMFDADWLMKQYSFGLSVASDGRVSRRAQGPAGLPSLFDLSFEMDKDASTQPEHWTRLWIVVARCLVEHTDRTMTFSEVKMGVKGRRQVPDRSSPTGLRDVDTDMDPPTARFAAELTSRYDEIARVSPSMARLKELAKVVTLANWLREHRADIDPKWAASLLTGTRRFVDKIQALRWSEERSTSSTRSIETRTIRLFGGADLRFTPEVAPTSETAARLEQQLRPYVAAGATAASFEMPAAQSPSRGLILPANSAGADVWKRAGLTTASAGARLSSKRRITVGDGTWELETESGNVVRLTLVDEPTHQITHEFAQGHVVRTKYGSSSSVSYTRDTDGRLMGILSRVPGGDVRGERDGDGTVWYRPAAPGREVRWRFGPDGLLREVVLADGQRAAIALDNATNSVTARTPDGSHTIAFGPDGSITHHWQTTTLDGKPVEEVGTEATTALVSSAVPPPSVLEAFGSLPTTSIQFHPNARPRGFFGIFRSRSALDVVYEPRKPAAAAAPPASNARQLAERFEVERIAFGTAVADGSGSIQVHAGTREFLLRSPGDSAAATAVDVPADLRSWLVASGPQSRLILSADGLSQDAVLRVLDGLRQTGNAAVYLASDLELAATNLGRLRPVTGPADLKALVPESSFGVTDYDVIASMTSELRRAGVAVEGSRDLSTVGQGDVLVVTGNKDAHLQDYLVRMGEANAFRGKLVVLLSCSDPAGADISLHSRLIRDYGALGVHFVPDQISPQAVKDVVIALARRLGKGKAPQTLDRLFRDAVDAAATAARAPGLRREIQKFLRAVSQLSRLSPLSVSAGLG